MIPKSIPKSLGIVGSWAIVIELACFYNELGTDVTVLEVQENIVPHEDKDISVALEKALLNLIHGCGFADVKFTKKIDFEKLYKEKFN